MARLQAQDYQSKRERIKVSATVLFAEKGFYGTSIIDIAKACNTVKSRLYYYFPSKGQLFYEIIKDHAEVLVETLLPILQNKDVDARSRLTIYANELLGMNVKYRDQHKLILNELGALTDEQAREIKFLLRRNVEALYPTLIELDPKLKDTEHLHFPTAMMFVGMINWTHTWYSRPTDHNGNKNGKDLSVDAFAQLLCDTFLDGYIA
jgi:AcrR family transcriptional regulator